MSEEATVVDAGRRPVAKPVSLRPHVRLLDGLRRRENWLQLIRFGIVGGSGFVVNLLVYALSVHALGIEYHVAAAAAWIVAGANNFVWNRHWTFNARDGQVHIQAIRFLLVSLLALAFNELVLTLLVERAGASEVAGQVLALAASTPLNFLGNKLWSFRAEH
jgi:putative flippase GtrA